MISRWPVGMPGWCRRRLLKDVVPESGQRLHPTSLHLRISVGGFTE